MRRFLFCATYLIPVLVLSTCWILYQTAKDGIHAYYDWVMKDYET